MVYLLLFALLHTTPDGTQQNPLFNGPELHGLKLAGVADDTPTFTVGAIQLASGHRIALR